MSTNPLRREGGYWKPVLDYEPWEDQKPDSSHTDSTGTHTQVPAKPPVRHDLCHHCGAEFVVDSPYCRMCGRARDDASLPSKARSNFLDLGAIRMRLGLSVSAMVCLVVGLLCVGSAIATGFIYTAGTFVDWQAIQVWRSEWLIAAGVAFVCGILLNGRKRTGV